MSGGQRQRIASARGRTYATLQASQFERAE